MAPLPWKQGNVDVLVKIKEILKGHKWCLDTGTLLGAVREGRLLPWRACLNSVIIGDYEKARTLLKRGGFRFVNSAAQFYDDALFHGGAHEPSAFVGFQSVTKVRDGYIRHLGSGVRAYVVKLPRYFYDKLSTCTLDGIVFPAPDHKEEYLKSCYGDWKKVVKRHRSWQSFGEYICGKTGMYKKLPKGCWHD